MQRYRKCFENFTASQRFRYHKLRDSKAWQKFKKQKQKNEQKTSHFFVQPARDPRSPTILGMVIEEVRPVFAPP